MQKVMKWFAPTLAIGVAIFITFFLISINSQEVIEESKPLTLKSESITPKPEEKVWLSHLSQTQKKGYFYPVNEVYVEVDLNEKITKTITYKLTAHVKDPYQLFCLREELKRHGLKYFLKKDVKGIALLIYSQNVDKLNSLVKVLKNYKILAQIKPYKEE
jgi:outer membrane usher protein FimD/PapC